VRLLPERLQQPPDWWWRLSKTQRRLLLSAAALGSLLLLALSIAGLALALGSSSSNISSSSSSSSSSYPKAAAGAGSTLPAAPAAAATGSTVQFKLQYMSPDASPYCKWSDLYLPKAVQPKHYKLHVQTDLQEPFLVQGEVDIVLQAAELTPCVVLHSKGIDISSVKLLVYSSAEAQQDESEEPVELAGEYKFKRTWPCNSSSSSPWSCCMSVGACRSVAAAAVSVGACVQWCTVYSSADAQQGEAEQPVELLRECYRHVMLCTRAVAAAAVSCGACVQLCCTEFRGAAG
jgi:hypothetical protein